jgi:hypothetical protein
MKRLLFIVALIALICCPVAWAQDRAELEVDHSVDSAFVSPHTDWATPYAQGTTRVLFFVNGRGTAAREVIELKQRFDLDAEMIFWGRLVDTSRDDWHGGENGLLRMEELLAREWDAFVFIGVKPVDMPADQQYTMIEAVTEGTGLVLVGLNDERLLKDKNRLDLPPFLSDIEGAGAFDVLEGRGVRIAQAPVIDYRFGWESDYDQWAMRLGKAILWAADREPALRLSLAAGAGQLQRDALPQEAVTLNWQGAGDGAVAEVTLRREDGAAVELPAQTLARGEGAAQISIPATRAGEYDLNVIAREGDRVAGFASLPLAVISERRVDAVQLDAAWAEPGGRLEGGVVLSGEPGADEELVVSLRDRRGRELARQAADADGRFGFDVQPWSPMLVEVRATLLDGGEEVASAWQFAKVTKRHRGQFNFVMWDVPRGNLAPVAEESLARTGVSVHLGGGEPPAYLSAFDMAWIPYTTHIYNELDEAGNMKPACWNDEEAIGAHVDEIVEKHVPMRQHGVFVYSLGDEIAVRGSCLSPHCLAAYRDYLQEQYDDIAALNASWGTDYDSFAEVELSAPDDNNEATALAAGNFPRWFDRQAYQSDNFCKLCERFGDGFRSIDPEARTGFEGAGTFKNADDLDGFVRSNDFWSPYPGTADEVLRSIAPRDFPRSNWMGYTKDADSLLEKYWRMVTRGCDAVWWWRWEVTGRFHGWLSPNGDPYPAVQEVLRDTQIVRDGLGDLLLHSEMQTDGIGMLYSLPSAYAAKVEESDSFGNYENNHSAFHNALRDLGLNFRYFTDRQMRLGEVNLSDFSVIILPMTQAMSAQEAQMLREYVGGGGVLIADIRPAIFDGHVKPLDAGQLDDVFGVTRAATAAATVTDGEVEVPMADGAARSLQLPSVRADGGIQAAGASAAGQVGEVPLLLTNSFGEGRAVLLNMAMSSYPTVPESEEVAELASRLLQVTLGELAPEVELAAPDGRRLRNIEVTRWMNGRVQVISIFSRSDDSEAVVRLPQERFVYDLKRGEQLGRQAEFRVKLTPSRAQFFALSPEPLGVVTLEPQAQSIAPGGVQQVRVTSALRDGQQAVKIEVALPDGSTADWVDPVVVTDRGGATVDVPVALNDPAGTWTLSATDVYSGETATAEFAVR